MIALPDGGFQVAWSGSGPGGVSRIFARPFHDTGKPRDPGFVVSTARGVSARHPAMDRDGDRVLIAWQAVGDALDPGRTGVVARRFTPDGTPLGKRFLINQTTVGRQYDPSVAFLTDGGFVAAWRGNGASDADGIFVREFNADGTPRGGEQRVNATVAGTQANPAVLSLGSMVYSVAWDGNVAGDSRGIATAAVQAGISMPDGPDSLNRVFFVGNADYPAPPLKTITLYNNTERMIYPVLENANAARDPNIKDKDVSLYDPQDPFNNEYRGYVGFADDQGEVWLGLRPGERVDIQVPLVFWNAGTIQILTSGDIFKDTATYSYKAGDGSKRSLQNAIGPNTSGRILWYHAPIAQNFGPDAPSQLVEYTIRDEDLATWAPNTPEKVTLINYDVSYVQDMMLPVAMEAADVPIPNTDQTQTYGWIGANLTVPAMQKFLTDFTADAGPGNFQPLLGRYFDGKGWDRYYLPDESVTGINIPANDRTFGLSPFGDVTSTYDSSKFMLASGGDILQVVGQGTTTRSSAAVTGLDPTVVGQLFAGMLVQPISDPPPVPFGTTIHSIGADGTSINLSAPATAGQTLTFAFVGSTPPPGPIRDYVVTKLTNLWYGWANYYAAKNGLPVVPYTAQVNPPTLNFTSGVDQADAFAKVVYDVMTAFSAIPLVQGTYLNASSQLMQNIVGANVALIPNITKDRERDLTVEVQSLLRGVADHRVDKDWYPDPRVATTGATENGNAVQYNVYNLDPFVWFVHEQLKLSGYGFSVDDDTADVGANGATQLLVSIGGVPDPARFAMNPSGWSGVAPWGPVMSTGNTTKDSDQLTGLDHVVVNQVNGPDPNLGVLGAIVSGPGIQDGTTIFSVDPINNAITLTTPATQTLSGGTYWFRGPNQELPTNPGANQPDTSSRLVRAGTRQLAADELLGFRKSREARAARSRASIARPTCRVWPGPARETPGIQSHEHLTSR